MTQPVDVVQAVVAHPAADLLLGHRPSQRQQLCAAVPRQEALDDLELELGAVLPHETPRRLPNFWESVQVNMRRGTDYLLCQRFSRSTAAHDSERLTVPLAQSRPATTPSVRAVRSSRYSNGRDEVSLATMPREGAASSSRRS